MEPTIHAKDIRLTPRLRSYIDKKTARLERYLPNMAELRVDLSSQNARNAGERHIAQMTLRDERGTILRAEERNADIFAAVDMVVDKMYRQIKRYRDKSRRSRQRMKLADALMQEAELEPLPFDDAVDNMDEVPVLVRRKQFSMQPMTSEEAIDQMDLLGHDFYVFFNTEEEAVNVVYRRRDSTYGLLLPELG